MVASPRGRLDPSVWRSTPDLEPGEGEQDERYDERTDRVLVSDVSGAGLNPGKNEGRLPTGTSQYMAATARNKTPRSPAISGRGRFTGRMYARTANFPLRRGFLCNSRLQCAAFSSKRESIARAEAGTTAVSQAGPAKRTRRALRSWRWPRLSAASGPRSCQRAGGRCRPRWPLKAS